MNVPSEIGDVGTGEVISEQKKDQTLDKIRKLVEEGMSNDKVRYYKLKGMVYREFVSSTVENGKKCVQLVVPKTLRDKSNGVST